MKRKHQDKKRRRMGRGCSALKALIGRQKRLLGIGLIIAAALFWFCLPSELFDTPYSTVILEKAA